MAKSLRYNIVDVFTDTPLTGNPLAVFTKGDGLSTETMQAIAREMNLSETVFFQRPTSGGHAKLRIFTPQKELPFAGHPILGSTWVLAGPMEMTELRLETGAGLIPIHLERAGDRIHVAFMSQPIPEFSEVETPEEYFRALGVEPSDTLLPPVHAQNGPHHILVDVGSRAVVESLRPDYSRLIQLTQSGVYAFAWEAGTAHARYFAPAFGIPEDPATGSAAGPLGAHLVQEGRVPSGSQIVVRQGETMARPSLLLVSSRRENGQLTEVRVGGAAVVIARGELHLP